MISACYRRSYPIMSPTPTERLRQLDSEIMDILAFEQHSHSTDPLFTFHPLAKQQEFINSIIGTECYSNYMFGSNRSGKTLAAVYAVCKLLRQGLPKSELVAAG